MLDINIYNAIYDFTKSKLEHSFAANNVDIDICRDLMPPSKTQAIVIEKKSFGNNLETYIDGRSLVSCEMNVVAVHKIGSYSESEMINTTADLENALYNIVIDFENGKRPSLPYGYSVKSMEVINNATLKALDVNTIVYSIDIIFQIACKP